MRKSSTSDTVTKSHRTPRNSLTLAIIPSISFWQNSQSGLKNMSTRGLLFDEVGRN